LAVDTEPEAGTNGVRWQRHIEVLWRRAVDRVVVLPLERAQPLQLSGTAEVIWELLERPHTLDELVAELRAIYGETPSILNDTKRALAKLRDEQVLIELA
jgi:hypothetical protein